MLTIRDAGCILKCTYAIKNSGLVVDKMYKTKIYDKNHLEVDDYVINDSKGIFCRVIGLEGVIAVFKMVKRPKGKYVGDFNVIAMRLHDPRRVRRMIRQSVKIAYSDAYKLKQIARNYGK